MRYITSELEEIEREDNFRLKRFKELKYKNKKGDDDTKKRCYCKKQPEKGDDFVCFVCKQEEEKRKQSKKGPCEGTVEPVVEVIGDKASDLSTVNQKRLDDLNAHLEKVISLTCQCKLDGLVSQSVDRLIYVCEEVRCKLENEPKQTAAAEQTSQTGCTPCKKEMTVKESQEAPCETCKEPEKKEEETKEDSLGYFETKYKETVKVMKFKNEDGTVSEERQVVTVKTEKKHPHKPNEFGMSPCCKIKQVDSIKSDESKLDGSDGNNPKETKSEEIPCCVEKEQTKVRSCVSDSGSKDKRKKETNESLMPKCCGVRDAATDPEPPTLVCCPKRCSSGNLSSKSKDVLKSNRSLKKKPSKKDVSSECKTEVKTVCCDSMWRDVASSTTGLAESSEETEELCICIKESETAELNKTIDKVSIGRKSANSSTRICCPKKSDEAAKKKSLHTCSICSQSSQSMKDTSTTTSNIVLDEESIRDKPSSIKVHSCISPPPEIKKSSSKLDKRPKPCCKDTKSNEKSQKPKTCCKIRIISNQGGKEGSVQEFIFFGNILDAIKKILVPGKSEESIIKTRNTKTPKSGNSLTKKSSFKSPMCKTCDNKVPPKAIERSQSCPLCSGKNVEKSISWSRRSQSADNAKGTKPCSCTPRADIVSKCSVCGSELSKAMKSDTASADIEDDECVSCEIESCPLSKTTTSSATNFNDQGEESCVCHSSKTPPVKPTEPPKPKCKVCYPEDPCSCHPKDQNQELSKKTKASESKCEICNREKTLCECYPKDTKNKQIEPPKPKCKVCYPEEEPCSCHSKDQNQEPPKNTKASESKCEICNREKAQCECYPKDAKNKQMEPPKPKCKVCYPEDPCSCHPKDQNQEPPKEVETLESKCTVCRADKKATEEETEPKSKCKTCFSDDKQNTSRSVQTETQHGREEDIKKPGKESASGICPLCSNEVQNPMVHRKLTDSVLNTKSGKSLCCDPSRLSKEDTDCKKCIGVVMKDASTSTRRSDRYDVRPLKLIKPARNFLCTCRSDSYLTERSRPTPKRCSSCHADYFK